MISKGLAILTLFGVSLFAIQPTNPNGEIEQILKTQAQCWNDGDIDGFMGTYWKSENLTFSGGGKTTRGWQATLDRYKKSYPSSPRVGQLAFGAATERRQSGSQEGRKLLTGASKA